MCTATLKVVECNTVGLAESGIGRPGPVQQYEHDIIFCDGFACSAGKDDECIIGEWMSSNVNQTCRTEYCVMDRAQVLVVSS